VAEAAVTSTVARDNSKDCECVAYIVREKHAQVTAQELVDYVAGKMSRHKAPTGGIVFCDSIPRNAMRKVIRHQLVKQEALSGSATYLEIS
jgi:4-coumarate--CoA ligase